MRRGPGAARLDALLGTGGASSRAAPCSRRCVGWRCGGWRCGAGWRRSGRHTTRCGTGRSRDQVAGPSPGAAILLWPWRPPVARASRSSAGDWQWCRALTPCGQDARPARPRGAARSQAPRVGRRLRRALRRGPRCRSACRGGSPARLRGRRTGRRPSGEFARLGALVAAAQEDGGPWGAACVEAADGDSDLAFLAAAWQLTDEFGVAAAPAARASAAVLRERAASDDRRTVLAAGPRASMWLLTLLPLCGPLVAVVLGLPVGDVYGSPPALAAATVGLGLTALGWFWSRTVLRRALRPSEIA